MGTRTALRQTRWITFGLVLAGIWIVLTMLNVYEAIPWAALDFGFVGQSVTSGVVGLLVLAVTLGLLVVLYGELAEEDPSPDAWPPE